MIWLAFSPMAIGGVIWLLLWWRQERQWKAFLRRAMNSYPWNEPFRMPTPEQEHEEK